MDLRASARVTGGLALDANALTGLKGQAKTSPEAALKTAATQFEALFLQQLMKSMRAAMPADGMMDSDTTKTYTEMLDAQLAQTLAKRGTGIADMLVAQLSRPGAKEVDTSLRNRAMPLRTPAAPLPLPGTTARRLAPRSAPVSSVLPAPAASGVKSPLASAAAAVSNAAGDFVATMRPYAEKAAAAIGVPVHYLLAQAGLETGWGKHQPKTSAGAPSNNLFGIKAGASWKGAVVEAETTEYVGGKAVRTVQRFRAYATPQEAFADFATVLAGNGRYAQALAAGTADSYGAQMQRAGYATDPAYGAKLASTIKSVARRGTVSQSMLSAQDRSAPADKGPTAA